MQTSFLYKKIIFCYFAILPFFCFAQNPAKWQAGIVFVPQYTLYKNATDTDDRRYESVGTYGLAYGAQIVRFLPHNWSVASEILYSEQNQNYEPNITLTQKIENFQREFSFLKIPFFIQKNIDLNKNTIFNADIGLQADILLNAQYRQKGSIFKTPYFDGTNNTALYTPLNMSAVVKFGLSFKANEHLAVRLETRADATLFNPDNLKNEVWNTANGTIDKTALPVYTNRTYTQMATWGLVLGAAYIW